MSRKWSLPILPTALPLYLIEPVDAELEAAIEAVEVSPTSASFAIPVVVSSESHQKLYSISLPHSSARNEKEEAASVKKLPVAMVR